MRIKECANAHRLAVPVIVLLLGYLRTSAQTGMAHAPDTNVYVQVTVSLSQKTFRPGQVGVLGVTFHPEDDIHITAEPPARFSLASTRVISLTGGANREVDASSGYLSTDTPVTQRFAVSKRIRKGTYTVKGSLVYYYCSGSKGLCRKKVEPLTLVLTVAP